MWATAGHGANEAQASGKFSSSSPISEIPFPCFPDEEGANCSATERYQAAAK